MFFIDLKFLGLNDIFPFVSINRDNMCSSFNDEVEYFDSNEKIYFLIRLLLIISVIV